MEPKLFKIKLAFAGAVGLLVVVLIFGGIEVHAKRVLVATSLANKAREIAYRLNYEIAASPKQNLLGLVSGVQNIPSKSANGISGNATSVPVLLYHGIVKTPDRFSMTFATFKDQMESLKADGWHAVSMQDFVDFIHGTKTLPDKSFLLTFDDGRRDSFEEADPLLRALGWQATMFLPSTLFNDPPKNDYYVHDNTLDSMAHSPAWEIESHAVQQEGGFVNIDAKNDQGNFLSSRAWLPDQNRLETDAEYLARITHEIADSKEVIESSLKKPVIAMSYPFGDFGQQSSTGDVSLAEQEINDLEKNNYQVAFQQVWPVDNDYTQNFAGEDPYHARRIESGTDWTGQQLLAVLDAGRTKALPYTGIFSESSGWRADWGTLSLDGQSMTTGANATGTGSFVFLDGTYPWNNYSFNAVLDWNKGETFSLVADYDAEKNNYYACVYDEKFIRIDETKNNSSSTLAQTDLAEPIERRDLSVEMSVNASGVACSAGSNTVSVEIPDGMMLAQGGIGFKTWDANPNAAAIHVKNLTFYQ